MFMFLSLCLFVFLLGNNERLKREDFWKERVERSVIGDTEEQSKCHCRHSWISQVYFMQLSLCSILIG